MSPREVFLRAQKKSHQLADRTFTPPSGLLLEASGLFPKLPGKADAPPELTAALAADAGDILAGRWKAFGHLPLRVSDPPRWQADALTGQDLQSSEVAFKLDHRAQPGGADIKVIWEPNRWYQLVRLGMAAWLADHGPARDKCLEWLNDWATRNPPFTGLNWTSGLETGIRLIQFTWIDALLAAAGVPGKTLHELRERILPAHARYTWRYKSFGSSANNHLIGELAGLIIAQARWPELARWSAPLPHLGALLEREILAQFAPDGGCREQALGYHLFSWEFCFQAGRALESAGQPLTATAAERLVQAGRFYRAVKPENDPWDFGDSDNAWVTPLFARETEASREWWRWLDRSPSAPALRYWWGDFPPPPAAPEGVWQVFAESGCAVLKTPDWFLRFDFSPLGYLSMAPHGHLDALHLSVWLGGQPVLIDPGTGAYYAAPAVRNYLASWPAHNGPQLKHPPVEHPKRFGTFLWGGHHRTPVFQLENPCSLRAELELPHGRASRTVTFVPEHNAVRVRDEVRFPGARLPVVTRWKFAPELAVQTVATGDFRAGRLRLRAAPAWKMARTYNPPAELRGLIASSPGPLAGVPLESLVSPAFRALAAASYLALESDESGPLDLILSQG